MNAIVPASLSGEVLPAFVRVLWQPHIFDETQTEVHHLPAGASLAEIVADVAGDAKGVRAWVDGRRVRRNDDGTWPAVYAARDVQLRRVPEPFLIPLIPVLAATIATATGVTATLAAAAGVSVALAGAVIGTVASVLAAGLGILFRPSQSHLQITNQEASPTYQISGFQNQISRFGVVPLVLGRHRIYPPYAALPNTEIVSPDQYIKALFIVGQGFINVSDIKIGETPIAAFADAFVTPFFVDAGGAFPDGLSNFAIEEPLSIDMGTVASPNPAQTRTTQPNTNAISIDLVAPEGIWAAYPNGRILTWYHRFLIEYRAVGAGSWTTLYAAYEMIGSVRNEVVRRGIYWAVPEGQYEIRLTSLADATPSQNTYSDRVVWTALRSHYWQKPVEIDYPATYIFARIRANEQLSGQLDTLNCMAEHVGYAYLGGGGWTAAGASSNPAAKFRDVLQGPGNARPIADSAIDFVTLNEWAEDCVANGWTYDRVHDFESSVFDTLIDICAAGRGEPTIVEGKWSVIWERSTLAPVVQAFTPRSTLDFSGQRSYLPQLHGLRARFVNQFAGYEQDERIIYADGYGETNAEPGRIEGVEFPGVTHPDTIWKLGRYHLAQQQLRRELYTIEVDIEQIACRRGDRVRVNHDVPKWGQHFGRVTAVIGDDITLDEPAIMSAGASYAIRFRSVDGSGNHGDILRTVLTVAGEQSTITVTGTGDLPAEGDVFMFGLVNLESVVLRVQAITPGEDHSARIELVDDAPGVLLADKGAIPAFSTNIAPGTDLDPFQFAPTDVRISSTPTERDGQPLEQLRISFLPPALPRIARHEVQYRLAFEFGWRTQAVDAGSREVVINVPPGEWQAQVRTHLNGPIGRSKVVVTSFSPIVTTSARSVFATPPDVTGARITVLGERATLYWNDLPGLTGGVEIRHSRAMSGAVVSAARVLATGVKGGSMTVPALSGTYLLRWQSVGGTYSVTPAEVVTDAPDLLGFNVVATLTEDPAFDGTKTGVSVVSGELSREAEGTGTYEFDGVVDLGAVYGARLEIVATAYAEDTNASLWDRVSYWQESFWDVAPEDWSLSLEYRVTQDDPGGAPDWSDWRALELGEVVGRGFGFRALLTSSRDGVAVRVPSLAAIVDMPDRVYSVANDYLLPSGGIGFSFVPPFKEPPTLGVTLQNAPQGAYHAITGKSETGFTLQVFNSSGTGITALVDVTAKGYGRQA